MASANSNIQLSGLDFNDIKTNLKTFLQNQDTFKDYNFEGSGLSVLLDILAYNTQYNGFYLNMVANEMFLDTALQRSSVVSQAKLLGYTPKSVVTPSATVNITVSDVQSSSLTLPAYTNFLSESVLGTNYNFVTIDSKTVNANNNIVSFESIELKQGIPATYSYVVNTSSNPSFTYKLPDDSIDTSTIKITVQKSSSDTSLDVYKLADDFLLLNDTSLVYFLQESLDGKYEIYFGDGIIGKKLVDGNIVSISYIVSQGSSASGANNFVLMDSVPGFTNTTIFGVTPASDGTPKESIDSIKFQSTKNYSSKKRAVTKEDYITIIQQNKIGIPFDAVNVWGGEENDTPVYGQVFICLKPAGGYNITQTQKERLIEEVIKPVSVMTVQPNIIDPDYTYLKLIINVIYNSSKTNQTVDQIKNGIKSQISSFVTKTLNNFNSSFNVYELLKTVQGYSSSIISSDYSLQLQKKFFPNLSEPTTYNFLFNTPLEKGVFLSGVSSSPSMQFRDPSNLANIITGVFIEETPSVTYGIDSISITNPGFDYISSPIVTINGDGTGATAHAIISNGKLKSIVLDSAGTGYTSATATITNKSGDNTGKMGKVTVNLQGSTATLRTYYYNYKNVKTVLNPNIGTINYKNGWIKLNDFNPYEIDNDLGQLTISVNPSTSIISSTYNNIITIDPFDPQSIKVNVTVKD